MKGSKKYYGIGTCIVAGFIIGSIIGAAMDNIAHWAGAGMCIGIVIGSFINYKKGDKDEK